MYVCVCACGAKVPTVQNLAWNVFTVDLNVTVVVVSACCSVCVCLLQCVFRGELQSGAVCCNVLQCVAMCCSESCAKCRYYGPQCHCCRGKCELQCVLQYVLQCLLRERLCVCGVNLGERGRERATERVCVCANVGVTVYA